MFLTPDDLYLQGWLSFTFWLPCAIFVFRGARLPIYHPVSLYLIYHFIGFVIRPFAIGLSDYSSVWEIMGYWPTSEETGYVLIVAGIGLYTMVFAPVLLAPGLYRDIRFDSFEVGVGNRLAFGLALMVVLILGIIGAASTSTFSMTETVNVETVTLEGGGRALVNSSGYLTMLADYLIILVVVVALVSRNLLLVLSVIGAYVAFRLTQGAGRSSFIAVGLAFAALTFIRRGLSWPKLWHVVPLLALLVAFDVLGGDRLAFRGIAQGTESVESVASHYWQERGTDLLTSDLAEIDNAVASIHVVHDTGRLNWGSQYLRLLVWPIPRQIWPDKPVTTGLIQFSKYSPVFNIITPTMLADTYSNFGLLAVVIGFAIFSVAFSKLYSLAANTTSPFGFLAFLMMTGYMTLFCRDGIVSGIFFTIVALPAAFLVVRAGKLTLRRVPAEEARARKGAKARSSAARVGGPGAQTLASHDAHLPVGTT